jgi:hypothetical protein
MIKKVCVRCKIKKDIHNFGVLIKNEDGHNNRCKSCCQELRKASYRRCVNKKGYRAKLAKNSKIRYDNNPVKARQLAKSYREKLRIEFIKEYGGCCICCGEKEIAFLTLEHANRDGAAHRKLFHTSSGQLADLRKRGWPKGEYTILCFNCNRATWELGICPHKKI